jgi:nucleoside-diphosphate-sugar epimerase
MREVSKVEKCVVTGGAGFIGSHLVDKLIEIGCEVSVVDNLFTGSIENIKHHLSNSRFKFERISILNNDLKQVFSGADTVFHLAAIPRVQYSISHPYLTEKVNAEGTLNILEVARKADVDRIIFSSSSSVYGNQNELPLKEDMHPRPISHYGVQKLTGEHYMRMYHELYGLKTVILRYFNVYGPRDSPFISPYRLIPHTIYLLQNDKSPVINGTGTQSRDFTYVSDVVNATVLAAQADTDAYGQPINIGTGKATSVIEMVEIIKNILVKEEISPIFREGVKEPTNALADIVRAKRILGWQPKINLLKGLESTIKYLTTINLN